MTDREGGKKMNRLDLIIDALEKANDGGNVLTSMRKHSPQPVNCGSWSLLLGAKNQFMVGLRECLFTNHHVLIFHSTL
jgi:hypothetical protein